ncbi:MAG: T9SS type A sorting domain-containing protein, partial [Flavobacteriales bacterium]
NVSADDVVKVFPNTAHEILFLELPSNTKELTLDITDISGKIIQSLRFDAMRTDRISIDVSNLPMGIYNLKWFDKTWFSKRFAVIH